MPISNDELLDRARQAREKALAQYSDFMVGAALLCQDGSIFTGCNIESSSYGLTVCAERVALFKALSEGECVFVKLAVVADTERLTPPCGACRQVLWDFCGDIEILLGNLGGRNQVSKLGNLFPEAFGSHLFRNHESQD